MNMLVTQVIEYNHNFHQADQPIILQYSSQIKLYSDGKKIHQYH